MTGIPSNEIVWMKRTAQNGDEFWITSKEIRDCYFIYKINDGKAIKLGKSVNPTTLEEKYIVE